MPKNEVNLELFLISKKPNTRRSYKLAMKQLADFTNKKLINITENDIARFFMNLKENSMHNGEMASQGTIRQRYFALSSIYEYLVDARVVKLNPLRSIRRTFNRTIHKQKRPTKWFTRNLVRKMLKLPDTRTKKGVRDLAMLAVLFGAGLRRSELISLNMDSIRIYNESDSNSIMYIYLSDSKSGEPQTRSLAQFTHKYISQYILQRKHDGADNSDPLFVFYYDDGSIRGRLDARTIARRFSGYALELGIEAAPHSARATFATRLKELGFEDRDVAQALGHSTETMVRVYDKRSRTFIESVANHLKY